MTAITRRALVGGAVAGAGTLAVHAASARATTFLQYPFTLGVASGDPLPDGVVLWTRLAPEPLDGGGMPRFPSRCCRGGGGRAIRRIVKRGTALALPELAHSVHVDVRGLEPGRGYCYRFTVGRTTARSAARAPPRADGTTKRLRFAFASCQDWQNGFFTAYRDMADRGPRPRRPPGRLHLRGRRPRPAARRAARRRRRSMTPRRATATATRSTRPTRTCRPRTPRSPGSSPGTTTRSRTTTPARSATRAARRRPGEFLARGAPTPTRPTTSTCRCGARRCPQGPTCASTGGFDFGDLAEFSVLDTRQYRPTSRAATACQPTLRRGARPGRRP